MPEMTNRSAGNSSLFLLGLMAWVVAGCVNSGKMITITVTDQATGQPVESLKAERYSPVSRWQKIVNPVGSTYHPRSLREESVTDASGQVVFEEAGEADMYRVYFDDARSYGVSMLGQTFRVPEGDAKSEEPGRIFTVWYRDGKLKHRVSSKRRSFDYQVTPRSGQATSNGCWRPD